MPLDPQVEQFLAELNSTPATPLHEMTPEQARRQMSASTPALGEPEEVASIVDVAAPSENGEIPLRVYHPQGAARSLVVYYHGGGWVLGGIHTHDGYCRALANASRSVVVSVDYRLAPEHCYPAAAEDAYRAACWISDNAASLEAPNGPMAVAGDSAGGNLAAATALMARDQGGPAIGLQCLVYPITDCNFETASYRRCADRYYLARDTMKWFWDLYCPDQTRRHEAYASPLRAENLHGLPPAIVLTAEYDPLCDEGEAYAQRLREAGVPTALTRYDGMIHGFARRLNTFDKARFALQDAASAIREMGAA